jgi:spermidine/putrescine transport system ATP-binding protein
LDEKPIRWEEDVWVSWHADDGFMLERYSESDETLIGLPPEKAGKSVEPPEDDVETGH